MKTECKPTEKHKKSNENPRPNEKLEKVAETPSTKIIGKRSGQCGVYKNGVGSVVYNKTPTKAKLFSHVLRCMRAFNMLSET